MHASVPCYTYGMNIGFVETDWERNIKRVSPFLGVLLIGAFTYFMYTVLSDAMRDITQSVHTETPLDVNGTIRLVEKVPVSYGTSINFRSTVDGAANKAMTYITTTCFQGDRLVYQRSGQQGVSFYLSDQYERDLEWDGASASCSATLMYRTVGDSKIDVFILDALSFEVIGKTNP